MTPAALPLALSALCALAAACDGDDDTGMLADAAPQAECDFDTPVDTSGLTGLYVPANQAQMTGVVVGAVKALDSGATDFFQIELYEGFGSFETGLRTGTFAIEGDEAIYADCGVCVSILADVDPELAGVGQALVANGGTLEITELEARTGGRFRATLTGATLREVSAGENGGQIDVLGGCTVALPTIDVDLTLAEAGGGA